MSLVKMMSNHHRRLVTPLAVGVGPSNKRKERDGFDVLKPSTSKLARYSIPRPGSPAPAPKPSEPAPRNQLLAGYLAHEFLTKGTLFGQPWDPARAVAVPVSADSRRLKPSSGTSQNSKPEPQTEKYNRYIEVADLLKTDGAHLPGIINPTQLARFLQL